MPYSSNLTIPTKLSAFNDAPPTPPIIVSPYHTTRLSPNHSLSIDAYTPFPNRLLRPRSKQTAPLPGVQTSRCSRVCMPGVCYTLAQASMVGDHPPGFGTIVLETARWCQGTTTLGSTGIEERRSKPLDRRLLNTARWAIISAPCTTSRAVLEC